MRINLERTPRLTKRGAALAALCCLLYVSSTQSESGLLFLIIGIIVGCFAVNLILAARSVGGLRLHAPASLMAVEGAKATVALELSNPGKKALGMLEGRVAGRGRLFAAGIVPPGETRHVNPELVFPRRGVYPYAELELSSDFPFGLVKAGRRARTPGEFVSLPAIYPCEPPKAAGFEPMVGGSQRGKRWTRSGDEFAGVRPYQQGDPLKSIHWKSSAKGLGLMAKEYNEELSGRVSLILDCSPGQTPDGGRTLDWACRAAGSLLFSALDVGHHAELFALATRQTLSVPPFSQGDEALELLARLPEREGSLNTANLEQALGTFARKSAICLILIQITPASTAFVATLAADGRTVSVYLPSYLEGMADFHGATVKHYDGGQIAGERR